MGLFNRRPRERKEPTLAKTADVAAAKGHSRFRANDPYAFEVAHRRLAWMFRMSAGFNVGLFLCLLISIGAIAQLVPLQKVQVGLVRIEPRSDQALPVDPATLVRILPVTKETAGFDVMMEAFARRYVRILLEVDGVSQDARMREALTFTDQEFWNKFLKDRLKGIREGIEGRLTRSILVESADRLPDRPMMRQGIYRYAVDIVQIDKRGDVEIDRKYLRAYLSITTRPQTVRPEERFENPVGFRVLDLALQERTAQ